MCRSTPLRRADDTGEWPAEISTPHRILVDSCDFPFFWLSSCRSRRLCGEAGTRRSSAEETLTTDPHQVRPNQNPASSTSRVLLALIRSTFALIVVGLLVSRVDWSEALAAVATVRLVPFGGALGLAMVNPIIEAARLRSAFGRGRIGVYTALRLIVVGAAYGSATPGQIGSEAYRAIALRNTAGGLLPSAVILGLIKLIGIAAVVAGAFVGGFFHADHISELLTRLVGELRVHLGPIIMIAGTLVAGCVVWLLYSRRYRDAVGPFRATSTIFRTLAEFDPRRLMEIVGWSVLLVALRTVVLILCVNSVGGGISPTAGIFIACCTTLATSLPVTVAGIGVREGTIALLLQSFGMAYEPSLVASVIGRIPMVVVALAGVLWSLFPPRLDEPRSQRPRRRT